VVGARGDFEGAVNLHDVNEALRGAADPQRTLARDVLQRNFETTTPEESLPRVLERFAAQNSERLPVLAADGTRRLVGTISKRDVLAAYARDLLDRRTGEGPAG
jgi:CBS domain-containing protein